MSVVLLCCYLFLVPCFVSWRDMNLISLCRSLGICGIFQKGAHSKHYPFFVSLDMSVCTTLQEVLTADAAKLLFFQKSPVHDEPDPSLSVNQTTTTKSIDETGTFIFFGFLSIFTISSAPHLHPYLFRRK